MRNEYYAGCASVSAIHDLYLFLLEFVLFINSTIISPSLLRGLILFKFNTLGVVAPQVAYKGQAKNWQKIAFAMLNINVDPHCKQEEGLLYAV